MKNQNLQDNAPAIMTVLEVAKLLRVEPGTVYRWFGKGNIPGGQRIGRSIRFSRAAILRWMNET